MKKKNCTGLAVLGLAAALAAALTGCESLKAIEAIRIDEVDIAKVRDGEYEFLQDNGLVTARVRLSVKAGRLADIRLLEHKHGPGQNRSAAPILARVVEKQSLKVDAVAGASGSSKVVLKAIESALKQGL